MSTDRDTPGRNGGDGAWLHKVKKSGELCLSRAGTTQGLPLSYYCSDWKKNAAAKTHDKENLRIVVTEGVPTYYAARNFRQEAQDYADRAEDQRMRWGEDSRDAANLQKLADFYNAVAERLAATAEPPKQKEPEKGIRFLQNGIKVDGGRLISCWYDLNGDEVTIFAKEYGGQLPREYFEVQNDTDSMTDYFDKDHTTLTPSHPLYRFARYVALKGIVSGKTYRKATDAQENEFAHMKDPGQPTAEDIQAVFDMKLAQENARKAAEEAERQREREETLRKVSEGRHYIESVAAQHPIVQGHPMVEIGFSESPYLYSLSHGLDNVFSVAAAEIILKHFDTMRHDENMAKDGGGYDKTDFVVYYNDPDDGEKRTYKGRYDLGDNDGGLIEHIRSFAKGGFHDGTETDDLLRFADFLESFTEGGRVVKVDMAPGVVDLLAYKKEMKQKEDEEYAKEWGDLIEMVGMLTDFQLEACVMEISPNDTVHADVAKFFLQEIARRDKSKAIEIFKKWKEGKGA